MLKHILMIANPGSGKGEAPDHAQELEKIIIETYDADVTIRETTKVGDAENWAKKAKSEGYDTVICLGGDGTVNEVVNGLMTIEEPPVFSFVPIGTVNDLGRVLGFDMSPELALKQFSDLVLDTLDIGQVNDQYFMDVVAVGDIPKAVMETDSDKKNRLGVLAYLIDGAKAILDDDHKEYEVTNSKGESFRVESNAILAALTSSVGGMENLVEHRDYNDGLLQFFALKGNVVASAIETLAKEGGIPEEPVNNETLLTFSDHQVTIKLVGATDEAIVTNVDGDEGPNLPLELKVYKEALKVLKPKTEA